VALARRRGIARPCGPLAYFGTNASEANRRSSVRAAEAEKAYLDRFADAIAADIRLSEGHPVGIPEFCAEERPRQKQGPLRDSFSTESRSCIFN